MAIIFVSHSKNDKDAIHFLLEAFAGTKVKPVLEEFESGIPTGNAAHKIAQDINRANAIFVLLSETVEILSHTRDWINWECGIGVNKDIWIFEPFESLKKLTVAVPRVTHLFRYQPTAEWRVYIQSVISSYDDSHIVPTLAGAAGVGAVVMEKDRGAGALAGFAVGLAGLIIEGMAKPSYGIPVRCWSCSSNYKVHLPGTSKEFRCATCNAFCILNMGNPG
ncbi:MAG: hypothetical protein ACYDCJ_06290 [Gammaproteobacteria bacterium]